MKICFLVDSRDVEGWIASFILIDAGYDIVSTHDYNTDGTFIQAWYETMYPFPVLICGHSTPNGLIVRLPKKKVVEGCSVTIRNAQTIPHKQLREEKHARLYKLWTCFCDFDSQEPTEFINLPGYNENMEPGYWMVTNIASSNKYREWLGNVKAIWKQKQSCESVQKLYESKMLPRILKYRKHSPSMWGFSKLQSVR